MFFWFNVKSVEKQVQEAPMVCPIYSKQLGKDKYLKKRVHDQQIGKCSEYFQLK